MSRILKAFSILFFCLFLIACSSDKKSSKKEVKKADNTEKPTSMVEPNDEKEVKDKEEEQENEAANDSKKEEPESEEKEEEPEVEAEPEGATPEQLEKADEIISSVSKKDIEAVDAKKIFRTHCAICHGFKGNMKINGAKDLTKSKISLTESVAQVYHGKGLMTPYNGIISDAEIVAVSKWIEDFRK